MKLEVTIKGSFVAAFKIENSDWVRLVCIFKFMNTKSGMGFRFLKKFSSGLLSKCLQQAWAKKEGLRAIHILK